MFASTCFECLHRHRLHRVEPWSCLTNGADQQGADSHTLTELHQWVADLPKTLAQAARFGYGGSQTQASAAITPATNCQGCCCWCDQETEEKQRRRRCSPSVCESANERAQRQTTPQAGSLPGKEVFKNLWSCTWHVLTAFPSSVWMQMPCFNHPPHKTGGLCSEEPCSGCLTQPLPVHRQGLVEVAGPLVV